MLTSAGGQSRSGRYGRRVELGGASEACSASFHIDDKSNRSRVLGLHGSRCEKIQEHLFLSLHE